MKVLFTADVHIKLGQKNVPIEWAKIRFNMLWQQLEDMQTECDLFVIGGDVFDKLPNMEELLKRDANLYIEFMAFSKRKRRQMMFIYLRKYNERQGLYLGLPSK